MLLSVEVIVSGTPELLPAFTTGRSKNEQRRQMKDDGKTFRTIQMVFRGLLKRYGCENIMHINKLQADAKKILRN